MSLLKAIGSGLGMFVLYTIGGVVLSGLPVLAVVLFMRLLGFEEGSTPILLAAGTAFVGVMFISWEQAVEYAIEAIKTRPRGLGLRQVTKWKDGIPYKDWEKY